MRKTKIIGTLGPASDTPAVFKRMVKAGLNVARINFSHGTLEENLKKINMVKEVREEMGVPIAIMMDSKGPEIRVKTFKGGKAELKDGQKFTLTTREVEGTDQIVSVTYPPLPSKLKPGAPVMLNDGFIEFKVLEVQDTDVICEVVNGGELSNRKSINLPGTVIDMPYLSDADKKDMLFGIANNVDYLAASFVRSAQDVMLARNFLNDHGGAEIDIIAKIENRQGVDNIDEIIAASDGIMVARGDMGVEIPFVELPAIQKNIIKKCYRAGKKVITATQMLESMISSPRPTRAEISDVANAVYDGTSATMLSGETAVGRFPVQAIKVMADINAEAEENMNYREKFGQFAPQIKNVSDAVSHATVSAAFDLNAAAVVVVTRTGTTARMISRFRPQMPIIAAVTNVKSYHKLAINWGVYPVQAELQLATDDLLKHALDIAKRTGLVKKGDIVTITAGIPVIEAGNTNLLKIEKI